MNSGRALQYTFGAMLVTLLAVASCSPSYEQVEIAISSDVKEAIEDATPGQEYGYYALETAHPEQAEDLPGMTLLVCGDAEPEIDLEVAVSTITAMGTPLFQSSKVYFINENLISGAATMTEDVSFNLEGGGEVVFQREVLIHARNVTDETLLEECIEAMRQQPETVLLVKRGTLGQQDELVELVFK